MALHPYWSGQIRISLVSFAVTLHTATRRSSQVPLHELSRETNQRIRHLNITEEGNPIGREDIVKGFEYEKGEYVVVEQDEIDNIKLPSSDTLELEEFADIDTLPALFCFAGQ
jgi:DNA end-binding protein Ku